MQKGTADKWIAALKSKKYDYACGQLRFDDCYCAMGVLLDVINPNGWKLAWDGHSYTWEDEQFYLPERIRKGSKIKTKDLNFETQNGWRTSLSYVSDYMDDVNRKVSIYMIENYYQQM
jgi:hypothetical protein